MTARISTAEVERRTREFAGIGFRHDRRPRAWLVGTDLDVWELIAILDDCGQDEQRVVADYEEVTPDLIATARAYAARYPDEIRAEIDARRASLAAFRERASAMRQAASQADAAPPAGKPPGDPTARRDGGWLVTIKGTAPPIGPTSGTGEEDSRILDAVDQLVPGSRRMDLDRIGNTDGKSRFSFAMTIAAPDADAAMARVASALRQAAPAFSIGTVECDPP